jgi:N-formylglutamate deformylase
MTPFVIQHASDRVPIIVSVPHCGTFFPAEVKDQFEPKLVGAPDDTDWFVHKLYEFAPSMGITLIHATVSRWVIDLNRDPENIPLYTDGRIITALCPTTNFLGHSLYKDERKSVLANEVESRLSKYYTPYHNALSGLLDDAKAKFGKVLLWDCHSIRHIVNTIQRHRFPDLNLGDNDGKSANTVLINAACETLSASRYSFSHNHPFKGGYITRHFGDPQNHVHALQLEMNKVNYMDDEELIYHPSRAAKMQELLKTTFDRLITQLIINE